MPFRPCPSGCGRFLSADDGHDRCLQCLGRRHAEAAFVDDSCVCCGRMSMISLRSRLSFMKGLAPSAATRADLSGSSRGSPADALGDLRVTVRASPPGTPPRTSYSSRSEHPVRFPGDFAGLSHGAPSISFGAPSVDRMSIAASGDGFMGWRKSRRGPSGRRCPPWWSRSAISGSTWQRWRRSTRHAFSTPPSPREGCSATPSRASPSSSRRYSSRPRRSSTSCPGVMHHPPLPPGPGLSLPVAVGALLRPPEPLRPRPNRHIGRCVEPLAGERCPPCPSQSPSRPGSRRSGPDAGNPEMLEFALSQETARTAPLLPPVEGREENLLFRFVSVPPLVQGPGVRGRHSSTRTSGQSRSGPREFGEDASERTAFCAIHPYSLSLHHHRYVDCAVGAACTASGGVAHAGSRAQFDSATRFSSPGDLPSSTAFSRRQWQSGTPLSCARRLLSSWQRMQSSRSLQPRWGRGFTALTSSYPRKVVAFGQSWICESWTGLCTSSRSRCWRTGAWSNAFSPRIGLQRSTWRTLTFTFRSFRDTDRFYGLRSKVGHGSTGSSPSGSPCLPVCSRRL